MKSSLLSSLANPKKIRKTVRISSQTQEKELSPEAKITNKENNFSKRERLNTISTIHTDQEFKDYLAERRKGIPVKEYRSNILKTLKNRDKLMSEIRKLKTRKSKSPSPSKQKEGMISVAYSKNDSKKRIQPQLLSSIITPTSSHSSVNKKEKSFFSIPLFIKSFRKLNKTSKKKEIVRNKL
jgi:hypothetical protein